MIKKQKERSPWVEASAKKQFNETELAKLHAFRTRTEARRRYRRHDEAKRSEQAVRRKNGARRAKTGAVVASLLTMPAVVTGIAVSRDQTKSNRSDIPASATVDPSARAVEPGSVVYTPDGPTVITEGSQGPGSTEAKSLNDDPRAHALLETEASNSSHS